MEPCYRSRKIQEKTTAVKNKENFNKKRKERKHALDQEKTIMVKRYTLDQENHQEKEKKISINFTTICQIDQFD